MIKVEEFKMKKMPRKMPSAARKLEAINELLIDGKTVKEVCSKFGVCRKTLWLWKTQYDGTLESLENKSCVPHTPHPNTQTEEEILLVKEALLKFPDSTYEFIHEYLRSEHSYSRHYKTMTDLIRDTFPELAKKNKDLRVSKVKILGRFLAEFPKHPTKEEWDSSKATIKENFCNAFDELRTIAVDMDDCEMITLYEKLLEIIKLRQL